MTWSVLDPRKCEGVAAQTLAALCNSSVHSSRAAGSPSSFALAHRPSRVPAVATKRAIAASPMLVFRTASVRESKGARGARKSVSLWWVVQGSNL